MPGYVTVQVPVLKSVWQSVPLLADHCGNDLRRFEHLDILQTGDAETRSTRANHVGPTVQAQPALPLYLRASHAEADCNKQMDCPFPDCSWHIPRQAHPPIAPPQIAMHDLLRRETPPPAPG